jgi:competence protein ComEC
VPEHTVAWRFAVLGALSAGLAVSPFLSFGAASTELVISGLAGAAALGAAAPRRAGKPAGIVWLCLLGLAFALVGAGVGIARVSAIDGGALDLASGQRVRVTGHVAAVPRRANGNVTVRVDTGDGRLLVEAPEPVPELPVGRAVRATGSVRDPRPWEESWLRRLGIRDVVAAQRIELGAGRRGGVVSLLDAARARAEAALGRGTDPARAALLRGFVLGQDDLIDQQTVEEFRRSGLSHLLAVSGQNVLLLALLAWPLLAVLGLGLRSRLVVTLALIAIYVPVAGAGPSIQRAGVMGAAAILAALASRPRSRAYVLLLATAVTLALNPRVSGDPGWQLSFAAVVGIMAWARPIRGLLVRGGTAPESTAAIALRGALADGVAVTVAATLATAPLIAHEFGVVSLASLPANLVALPAVAPVMWLGMLAGLAGQLPWLPVEPLTWLAGGLAGYVAQVASWLAAPSWAQVDLRLDAALSVIAAYAALALVVALALRWGSRRAKLRPGSALATIAVIPLAAVAVALLGPSGGAEAGTRGGAGSVGGDALRVSLLDVGQGDAILLQPGDGDPVLVDAGPAEADVAGALSERGIDRLGALVATHPESDHVGGIPAVLRRVPTDRLLYAGASRGLLAAATASETRAAVISEGVRLRSGSLRLSVLWPPRQRLYSGGDPTADPNALSVVLLAQWGEFELLLTGDAEAELTSVDPGPVEVLKVAHHGSEDAGLDHLLDQTAPQLAVVSVGEGNPFGHPSPATLTELADHGVPLARTDVLGTLTIDVAGEGFSLSTDR